MSAFIPIKVECEGWWRESDRSSTCDAIADARLIVSFKGGSKKVRGEIKLPEGWIESGDYEGGEVSYYCPRCGTAKSPWRYGK